MANKTRSRSTKRSTKGGKRMTAKNTRRNRGKNSRGRNKSQRRRISGGSQDAEVISSIDNYFYLNKGGELYKVARVNGPNLEIFEPSKIYTTVITGTTQGFLGKKAQEDVSLSKHLKDSFPMFGEDLYKHLATVYNSNDGDIINTYDDSKNYYINKKGKLYKLTLGGDKLHEENNTLMIVRPSPALDILPRDTNYLNNSHEGLMEHLRKHDHDYI